ncbi:MAG: hypothetical protein Q7R51_00495 [bacterium]|nr:hypothetical protein [bacterium]
MSEVYKSFFPHREGMDLTTPHGDAQARLDEMFEVAITNKTRVTYENPDGPKAEADAYFIARNAAKKGIASPARPKRS